MAASVLRLVSIRIRDSLSSAEDAMSVISGRRFLVTGGAGFVGSALTKALAAAGAYVRVLDNESRGSARRLAGTVVDLVTGDIRDPQTVRDAVRGVDAVCHLAYINGTEFFYEKPELVLDVAVRGMLNVLDACIHEGVRELALASSSEVYQTPDRIPTDESAESPVQLRRRQNHL
jgi:dTDP-glucose 4,6-dehydratase/UDP-glucose 4-epimerase